MRLTISIHIFEILDSIILKHGIKMKDWATASGLPQPRISELRRLYELDRDGKDQGEVGRIFSLQKCAALVDGLRTLLGGDMLQQELLEKLQAANDKKEKLILMVLALSDTQDDQAELYLQALLKTKGE